MNRYIFYISLILSLIALKRSIGNLSSIVMAINSTDKLSGRSNSIISSIYRTFKILYSSMLIMIYRKLYGSIYINKNLSYAYYFHNTKWYYFPLNIKKGPKPVITRAIGDNNTDVTDFIVKLAGPNVDFYGTLVSPKDINMNRLLLTVDGNDKIFERDTPLLC